jgi:hypothetical protein
VAVNLLGGGSVSTVGANSAGLLAIGDVTGGNQATITADGLAITTGTPSSPQQNSPGAEADPLGVITLNGASAITTYGSGSVGLLAVGEAFESETTATGGSIVVNGALTLKTNDPTTPAVELEGVGSSIEATGGGTIASAYRAIEFLNGSGQTATFNGFTSITGSSGDLIVADGASGAALNFTGTTANAGLNNLLHVTNESSLTFNAALSTLTGAFQIDTSSTATVKLTNGAIWNATDFSSVTNGSSLTFNADSSTLTGAIQTETGSGETPASTSTVNLTNGSTWNVTGSSTVTNLSVTNSSVVFAGPTEGGGFKTITVSSYSGSGASVTMNVALVGAGTPSGQLGDQIIVSGGSATGSTNVVIVNTTPISLGQSINRLIPLFVTTNGGTIAPGASFVLAGAPNAAGYTFSLEETATGVDLVATPTTSQTQLGSSVNNVAASQQKALITSQVLTSILLGATEQVNCSNCGSGFGGIGSYSLGAHGRTSLTPELTLMGGFAYNEYSAPGITVTNAPTFAASLVYDPTNFGQSRPFFEVGGGVIPFEQVHYTRIYPYAGEIALGYGNAIDRSLGLFARVGWVDRVTPNDEAAIYTDVSRSWLQSGGYTEATIGANPIPATVSTGLEALNVARVGAQWTHLFANQFEVNGGAALAYGFDAVNTQQWAFTGYSPIAPYPISNSAWCEWGARVGYRLGNRMVVDAFAIGTLGGQIGATIHGGLGMRYLF